MARPTWKGAISFGLVSIPVALHTAVSPHDVRFHQVDRVTGARVHQRRVAGPDEREVPYADVLKGAELPDGRTVVIEPRELDQLAPHRGKVIDLEQFVSLDEIDPVLFERTYHLAPLEGAGPSKPYALLLRSLATTRRVGIGRVVLRSREHLVAVRAAGEALVLSTLYFADEVRDPLSLEGLPVDVAVTERECAMAEQLIDSLSEPWDPDRYQDTYRQAVLDLVAAKAAGEEIVPTADEEPTATVIDLVAALEASLAAHPSGHRPSPAPHGHEAAGAGGTRSRQELYERAQALGIAGRSRMRRDELEAAVAAAEDRQAS